MENNETITTLKGVEERTSKQGRKYFSFTTDDGAATCFENSIVDELKKRIGKRVRLEIAEKNGFKNIRKFLGDLEPERPGNAGEKSQPVEEIAEARKLKDVSIYTSYAKDIFIELLGMENRFLMEKKLEERDPIQASKLMEMATTLIKQARTSFSE